MLQPWTRRELLLGLGATLATACAPPAPPPAAPQARVAPLRSLDEIEASVGGRVGVFAIDTGSGRQVAHRQDERFAMCSTFKWVLSAAVLARVDRGELALAERIRYAEADLLEHAPITRAHLAEGAMTIEALMQAAIIRSDNTAANLLLPKIDGPAGLTRFFAKLGDTVSRLDRDEPSLNENLPGDPRDTTSPRAMVGVMRRVLCEDALSPASRDRLLGWLRACETGKDRLRGGLPADWVVGDKTGSGGRCTVNDVAIAHPPGRAPILIAAYLGDGEAGLKRLCEAHVEIARLVAQQLA